jgi:hypothetical protein
MLLAKQISPSPVLISRPAIAAPFLLLLVKAAGVQQVFIKQEG